MDTLAPRNEGGVGRVSPPEIWIYTHLVRIRIGKHIKVAKYLAVTYSEIEDLGINKLRGSVTVLYQDGSYEYFDDAIVIELYE